MPNPPRRPARDALRYGFRAVFGHRRAFLETAIPPFLLAAAGVLLRTWPSTPAGGTDPLSGLVDGDASGDIGDIAGAALSGLVDGSLADLAGFALTGIASLWFAYRWTLRIRGIAPGIGRFKDYGSALARVGRVAALPPIAAGGACAAIGWSDPWTGVLAAIPLVPAGFALGWLVTIRMSPIPFAAVEGVRLGYAQAWRATARFGFRMAVAPAACAMAAGTFETLLYAVPGSGLLGTGAEGALGIAAAAAGLAGVGTTIATLSWFDRVARPRAPVRPGVGTEGAAPAPARVRRDAKPRTRPTPRTA